MARAIFQKGEQENWIDKLLNIHNSTELAKISGVNPRTFRDWHRGKYNISKGSLLRLSKYFNAPIPTNIKYLSDYWYVSKGARKGAMRRLELYGLLGNKESRRKGGIISQQRRRENPEKYRLLGCNVRKNFAPLRESIALAETIGIVLGDGGITNSQLRITLDRTTDRKYAFFVKKLMKKVFNQVPSWYEYERDNTIDLCISGVSLIEELARWGLEKGDKILRQVDFPSWIWLKAEYQKACVRGLMDTDGGLYFHNHWTKGIKYRNLGLCFTSMSKPLLFSVAKVLTRFNMKHSTSRNRIYIYDLKEVEKYLITFDSSNPKNKEKLRYHLSHSKILDKIIPGGVG